MKWKPDEAQIHQNQSTAALETVSKMEKKQAGQGSSPCFRASMVTVMEVAANQSANQIFTVIPLLYWFPFS